ncbi:MAG: hypothetical protein R3B06_11045 [Kofleriaceae bacterium]
MLRSLRLVHVSLAAVAALALAAGCRDTGGDDQPGTDGGIDAPQGSLTIQDVQSDTMVPGTPVELKGKVVTAIDNFGSRKGNFWIGEEGGGEYSGVLVFGAPIDQVALLAVGDKVDISGAEKTEFALTSDTSGRTTTELQPVAGGTMSVTKVGTGTVPTPHVIDNAVLDNMDEATRYAEFEKWEGVLTRVDNVAVTSGITQIGGAMPDPTFREFVVTGGLHIDSSLAAIPTTADGGADLVSLRDCLASVTGIGDYFFSYKILPRATTDVVPGGTGCAAASSSTIEEVRTGQVTGLVTITDVIVTALDLNGTNSMGFWVQQAEQAAANRGVLVFTRTVAPNVAIGDHVNVTGMVEEFDLTPGGDTLTEITGPTVTVVSGNTTPLPLAGIAVTTLSDIGAAGEPYESVLVTLTNLRVTLVESGDRLTLTDGTNTIVMDDESFNYGPADYPVDTCFASVTGVMGVNTIDDQRRIFPRNAADLVTGTGCL